MHKFESPKRVAELNPKGTLRDIGLKDGDVFCDIGAGPGVFTIPAAGITQGTVFAIDILDEMLDIIGQKCAEQGIDNVTRILAQGYSYPIAEHECDIVFMSTVFHEVDDTDALLSEIDRVLKEKGKLVIIELHKRETPIGPPVSSRIGESELKQIVEEAGFVRTKQMSMGENLYLAEFTKKLL